MRTLVGFCDPWWGAGVLSDDPITRQQQKLRSIEIIHSCAEYAVNRGVKLVLEPINRYETNFLNTIQECLDFIAESNLMNVYILADSFHMNIEEKSITDALAQAGSMLQYLHFSDSNRKAPGQGHFNFFALVQQLKKIGYHGYVCAEILPLPDSYTAANWAIGFYKSLNSYVSAL